MFDLYGTNLSAKAALALNFRNTGHFVVFLVSLQHFFEIPYMYFWLKDALRTYPTWWFAFLACFIFSLSQPLGDFGNYYFSARFFINGLFTSSCYDPFTFNQLVHGVYPFPVFLNLTPVPPVTILFYATIAWIPHVLVAKTIFNLAGWLLFIYYLIQFSRFFNLAPSKWIHWLPILLIFPLLNNTIQGQSYLFLSVCMMAGLMAYEKGKKWLPAFWWSIPIVLKIFPALIILYPLTKKDFKTSAIIGLFVLCWNLSAVAFLPDQLNITYFLDVLPRLAAGEINNPYALQYQSARVFIMKWLVYDHQLNPDAAYFLPEWSQLLHLAYQITVGLLMISILNNPQKSVLMAFGVLVVTILLLTGYGSSYSLVWLFFLFAGILHQEGLKRKPVLIILIAIAANLPVYLFSHFPFIFQFPRWYALLAVLVLLWWQMGRSIPTYILLFTGCIFCFKGLEIYNHERLPDSQYYFSTNKFGIIGDYQYENGHLMIEGFTEKGLQKFEMMVTDSIYEDKNLEIRDNQIFYHGLQKTFNKSNKRKPLRLNGQEAIFLSDENRGPGFYTLKTIKLNP